MQRMKYWCEPCDYVTKSQGPATCPYCRQAMRCMGDRWRVGKKGRREDWKQRDPTDWIAWPYDHLALLGKIVYDKKRGLWRYTRDYKNRKRS